VLATVRRAFVAASGLPDAAVTVGPAGDLAAADLALNAAAAAAKARRRGLGAGGASAVRVPVYLLATAVAASAAAAGLPSAAPADLVAAVNGVLPGVLSAMLVTLSANSTLAASLGAFSLSSDASAPTRAIAGSAGIAAGAGTGGVNMAAALGLGVGVPVALALLAAGVFFVRALRGGKLSPARAIERTREFLQRGAARLRPLAPGERREPKVAIGRGAGRRLAAESARRTGTDAPLVDISNPMRRGPGRQMP